MTFQILGNLSNFNNQTCYTNTTYLQYLILIIFYIDRLNIWSQNVYLKVYQYILYIDIRFYEIV